MTYTIEKGGLYGVPIKFQLFQLANIFHDRVPDILADTDLLITRVPESLGHLRSIARSMPDAEDDMLPCKWVGVENFANHRYEMLTPLKMTRIDQHFGQRVSIEYQLTYDHYFLSFFEWLDMVRPQTTYIIAPPECSEVYFKALRLRYTVNTQWSIKGEGNRNYKLIRSSGINGPGHATKEDFHDMPLDIVYWRAILSEPDVYKVANFQIESGEVALPAHSIGKRFSGIAYSPKHLADTLKAVEALGDPVSRIGKCEVVIMATTKTARKKVATRRKKPAEKKAAGSVKTKAESTQKTTKSRRSSTKRTTTKEKAVPTARERKKGDQKVSPEARRQSIVHLYMDGWSQLAMAEFHGVTQQTISKDFAVIREAWSKDLSWLYNEVVNKALARIDWMETEAIKAWKESLIPYRKISQRKGADRASSKPTRSVMTELNGKPHEVVTEWTLIDNTDITERQFNLTEEGKLAMPKADWQAMATIKWCVQERMKIIGGYADTRIRAKQQASQEQWYQDIVDLLQTENITPAEVAIMFPDEAADMMKDAGLNPRLLKG